MSKVANSPRDAALDRGLRAWRTISGADWAIVGLTLLL
jgi:hypothetical protein